jgi:hypothetical protein
MANIRFLDQVSLASFESATSTAGSVDTGSLLYTASIQGGTITFTKGDGSTFDIEVLSVTSSISSSFATTASLSLTSLLATTASLALTSSFTPNAVITGSATNNVITLERGDGSTFDLTVETTVSPFPYTGSAEVTGSLGVTGSFGVDIEDGNGGNTKFKVNDEGVVVLAALITTPTAITGGMYYSSSGDFYLGSN